MAINLRIVEKGKGAGLAQAPRYIRLSKHTQTRSGLHWQYASNLLTERVNDYSESVILS